jgi:hypothetical protein
MLLLTSTSDVLQVITASAVAAAAIHASWMDYSGGTVTPGRQNLNVSTATTSNAVPSPGASTYRNVKLLSVTNTNASSSNTVTINHTDGTTVVQLWKGVLQPGCTVVLDESGGITVFSSAGLPYAPVSIGSYFNNSTAQQTGFAADTYLAGSNILFPNTGVRVGTRMRWIFDMTKTAAGIAAPVCTVRFGTAGTTADTAIHTLTFAAGTAAADTGRFVIELVWRSVGASGVSEALASLISNQAAAGLSGTTRAVVSTSAAYNTALANGQMGVSFNGGTSFAGTNQLVAVELANP